MYRIFTDTSANLSADLIRRYSISVVTLRFTVNGTEDTAFSSSTGEFNGHEFYTRMREGAEVKTTMANMSDFLEAFRPILAAGEDVLYVGMSSGISGTYHAAELAAEELRESYPAQKAVVVDTRAASLGEGLPVLVAAQAREEGHSLEKAALMTRVYCDKICQYFTVADLRYLQMGGRISRFSARIGSVLNIKPVLQGNEQGEIILHSKVRGTKHALAALAERYRELCSDRGARIGIAHADAPEQAEQLLQHLRAEGLTGQAVIVCYEPVTGSHVGPGTVALFFPGIHR